VTSRTTGTDEVRAERLADRLTLDARTPGSPAPGTPSRMRPAFPLSSLPRADQLADYIWEGGFKRLPIQVPSA
jgi:hypothetical protein